MDYDSVASTELVLNGATTLSIGLNILDDSIYESDIESFVVELYTTNSRVSLSNNTAIISIRDNDG